MTKDNSTGKNKDFYELGKKMFDRLNPMGAAQSVQPVQPAIKEFLKVHASAEDYLRHRYGAYRGHFAWRELQEAYSQGRYDEEMAQGPSHD